MRRGAPLLVGLVLAGAGCRQDMHDQPRFKPYAESDFFGDNRSARAPVAGTVARGTLRENAHLFTGKLDGAFATTLPMPLSETLLRRGQERYAIYCTPCHGQTGAGDGIVVRRGYRRPTSFHIDRLRGESVGYVFDVISNGFGAMPDYAAQITPEDRWAIAAYFKVLQLSQHAAVSQLPAELVGDIGAPATPAPAVEGQQ